MSVKTPIYAIKSTETAKAKFLKVLFSWATKPEDCVCVHLAKQIKLADEDVGSFDLPFQIKEEFTHTLSASKQILPPEHAPLTQIDQPKIGQYPLIHFNKHKQIHSTNTIRINTIRSNRASANGTNKDN